MARPRKQINEKQVLKLAQIQCTVEEMAAVLGCSKRTLETRFYAAIKAGREQGRASVRRQQYKLLMAGNATMAVWLGKQVLGQTDIVRNENHHVDYTRLTEEQLGRIARGEHPATVVATPGPRGTGTAAPDEPSLH